MSARWSKLRTAALKIKWADGDTAGGIAEDFGCTRSAVIGKLNRLGLIGQMKAKMRGMPCKVEPKRKCSDLEQKRRACRETWRQKKLALMASA